MDSMMRMILVGAAAFLIGCSSAGAPPEATPDGESRVSQIAASSAGDMSKLSAADREFMLKRNSGDAAAAENELKKFASGY